MNNNELNVIHSEDFHKLESEELHDCCVHMICTAGEGSFVFNDTCFHIQKNSLAVISHPGEVSNLAADNNFKIEMFAADYRFLQGLLPSNSYSIGGSASLYNDPIIPLSEPDAMRFLDDIHRLRDRKEDRYMTFYREVMGSLCLTMMYDIFEFHSEYYGSQDSTDRTTYIVREFFKMLSTGITRTERDVSYFAERLDVSMKYLSSTVKRTTGNTVSEYINRATVPILRKYLNDSRLSLTQISDLMNFSSLSYFSRYCMKHLGMAPSEYRMRKQPSRS